MHLMSCCSAGAMDVVQEREWCDQIWLMVLLMLPLWAYKLFFGILDRIHNLVRVMQYFLNTSFPAGFAYAAD